uniref:PIN domain-like protein n=1 Tax=Mycena chlorophos TaxID=658473 RepID=A0ABQ0LX98_MYCCL|nr:predicted protein [Mycena chlorophos]
MGVKGLWAVLEPAAQKICLPLYAVSNGFSANLNGDRVLWLGIDASEWMYRAAATPGSPVKRLFAWVERFSETPIVPVFVFDGEHRPNHKNGRRIRVQTHWLTAPFQKIIESFGFCWFMAAGEAEATLAKMNTDGIPVRVDAVQTEDGDALVFGAEVVLHIVSFSKQSFDAIMYSAHDIEQKIGLAADDLVLVALLSGGDYDAGLKGCGTKIAAGLARAGLGRALADGVRDKTPTEMEKFLPEWRDAARQELATNTSGFLPSANPKLAALWPTSLASVDILNLYFHPSVSGTPPNISPSLQPLQLDKLADFARANFNWGTTVGILERFAKHIFSVVLVRELVAAQVRMDMSLEPNPTALVHRIVRERAVASMGYLRQVKVELNLDRPALFASLGMLSASEAAAADAWMDTYLAEIAVWIPKTMLESVMPSLVLDFVSNPKQKKIAQKPVKTTAVASTSTTCNCRAAQDLTAVYSEVNPSREFWKQTKEDDEDDRPGPDEIADDLEGEMEAYQGDPGKDNEDQDGAGEADADGDEAGPSGGKMDMDAMRAVIAENSKGVVEATDATYKRGFTTGEEKFFSAKPVEDAPLLIVAWIMSHCDEINPDRTKKPTTQERDSYSHAQKMRATATYAFGRLAGLGAEPWHRSEVSGQMIGNPSVSEAVSRYMVQLFS